MRNREIFNAALDVFSAAAIDCKESKIEWHQYATDTRLLSQIDAYVARFRHGDFVAWLADHIFDAIEARYVS